MKYKIVCKKDDLSQAVCAQLKVLINEAESDNPDIVFSIGGDGTFLDAVRRYLNRLNEVIFVAIHTGTLGFYTEYVPSELETAIKNLKNINKTSLNTYPLLEVDIDGDIDYALNEVTLSAHHHLLEGDVFVNKDHLMTMRANGLCISTPSGSTAYNKSLKGAIMDPNVNALQLALIAPFETVDSRMISPIVLSKKHTIIFKPKNKYIDVTFDRMFISKEQVKNIKISYSNKYVKYMINPKNSFIKRINEKFIGN